MQHSRLQRALSTYTSEPELATPGRRTLTSGVIARQVATDASPAAAAPVAEGLFMIAHDDDVSAQVDAAAQTSASSLGSLAGPLGAALGTDVSGVRIHTGAESQQAAASLQANAYTIGDDIHFGAGQYQPGTPDGNRLIAHEVAHTVQQRGASDTGTLEVSTPGDAHEVEAERFADAVVAGGTAPVSRGGAGLSRKMIARDPSGPNAHVGGSSQAIDFLDNPETHTVVAPGERGYSDQVLRRVGDAAGNLAAGGTYQDARIRHVLPNTSIIDSQIRIRADEKARLTEQAGEMLTGHFLAGYLTNAATWAQNHTNTLTAQKEDETVKFGEYNAYVSNANSFFESLLRLDAMQNLLGVDSPQAMASALVTGLHDAREVAGRAREAFTNGDAGSTRALNVPESDASVTTLLGQVNLAQREAGAAHQQFRLTRLEAERVTVNAEGDSARTRQAEIEQTKAFIRQVGGTIDLAASVVTGAPAVLERAGTMVRTGEAHIAAARNRRAILAGGRPTHNPTYLATNDDGDMVIRNAQTGTDTAAEGGPSVPAPAASLPELPSSVSDILGTLADFAYAEELRTLTRTLNGVAARCEAIDHVHQLTELAVRARNLSNKVVAFSQKCNELNGRLTARRQAYLDLGVELDNFARRDAASRREGQAPAANGERFATIFMVTSAVREVVAVGRSGVAGMPMTPDQVQAWWLEIHRARNAETPWRTLRRFHTGEDEYARVNQMYGQLSRHQGNVEAVLSMFSGVESAAGTAMTAMSPASAGAGAREPGQGGPGDY
jgi:hypothetical protein